MRPQNGHETRAASVEEGKIFCMNKKSLLYNDATRIEG